MLAEIDDPRDQRWLTGAASLAARGVPLTRPNPSVGALIVKDGLVVARGRTGPGGRPHAEAAALEAAGQAARGATLYVTLEPCAHQSPRGPACAELVATSGLARVVVGCGDPDPRTAGAGIARIRAAGIAVDLVENPACIVGLAGYLTVQRHRRPHVTLKLALSQDGRLARAPGEPRWLTGEIARAHVHACRARMDAILVGRGTFEADNSQLDVRLPGLEERSPERWLLSSAAAPAGWRVLPSPGQLGALLPAQYLMVEGGAATARAFLAAGLVDRMMLYRAPFTLGGDFPALPELIEAALAASPNWTRSEHRLLGNDTLDVYDHKSCSLE